MASYVSLGLRVFHRKPFWVDYFDGSINNNMVRFTGVCVLTLYDLAACQGDNNDGNNDLNFQNKKVLIETKR